MLFAFEKLFPRKKISKSWGCGLMAFSIGEGRDEVILDY